MHAAQWIPSPLFRGPLPADRVRGFERMINHPLPAVYLDWLSKNNGGIPARRYFRLGGGDIMRVSGFFGFSPDPKQEAGFNALSDILVFWSRKEGLLTDGDDYYLVPIALVNQGFIICLDLFDSASARVVILDLAQSDEWKPATRPIASDFMSFLALLKESEQDAMSGG